MGSRIRPHKPKYLQAILKETLCLHPPGQITGLCEAMKDYHLGGYFVPKGTHLLVNIWKLQRDPRMWANPCQFQPERFMTTHADVDFKGQSNFKYIPFSAGRGFSSSTPSSSALPMPLKYFGLIS
ncbi:dimethylnonatriene synthase-like [Pyrus x bretschneideri]|uniref:dimethylnonatriene synthase-like n=1 Tax=Pyrus x bretschneideri TaxID=225117 RepID=UPI0020302E88|nr:dimethylnonatriene synthase-like [Pyrus x bretschneideri]